MFDLPPKCPALANKLSGIFGWRHKYEVSAKHDGIKHTYLQKSYSLTLPTKRPPSPILPFGYVKDPGSWVSVHHLQTQSGILDPDDCVRDVADDREYIHASFEDSSDPGVPQGGGDGASGSSSVGTGSPDIFRDPTNTDAPTNGSRDDTSTPHIEVTSTTPCPMNGLGLQVRRSSDPNMLASLKAAENGNKRWSAAAPHCAGDSPERLQMDKAGYLPPQWEEEDDMQHQVHHAAASQPFARSGRLSMQFLGEGTGYKWMDAAEKLQQQLHPQLQQQEEPVYSETQQQQQQHFFSSKSLPRESTRKEPLGQAYESIREKDGEMLLLINEYGSPLGLRAIPDNEHGGGLLVQHVEAGSRADRGRLRKGDRILEINGTKLMGLTEGKVQEYLRRALESSELRVRVIRGDAKANKNRRRDSKVAEMIEAEEKMASSLESKVATVSPTRKPNTAPVGATLQVANTRKLGRKIEINLKKGPNGLGFSVTTRDNPAGGHCPIYIKNILPRGAAIEDGNLKPGDRLLEVDGIPMTGKSQTDVVSILRATQPGATVRLIVSRQHELAEPEEREINFENKENILVTPPKPPAPILPATGQKAQQQYMDLKGTSSARSLFEQHQEQQKENLNKSQHFIDAGSESAASSDSLQNSLSREMLTLHIPVHDTEKAGLGVSVKGKTSSNITGSSNGSANGSMKNDGDLGIFVKSVIHGGAASRDGRLRMNDQLISVNGVTLLGQSNAEAMDTLKRAIVNNPGKHPGMITLQVARKITRSASSGDILEQSNESSNTSDNSGTTVICVNLEKRNENRGSGSAHNIANDMNRWSNPVLNRLTGGTCSIPKMRTPATSSAITGGGGAGGVVGPHGLRNESYYMATNETWSPAMNHSNQHNINNTVLIEHDPEPTSPILPYRPNESISSNLTNLTNGSSSIPTPTGTTPLNFDATYSSQLSLETNNSGVEHFSRDAIGRQSMSEKIKSTLDPRQTGTYKRNQEKRDRERRLQLTKSAVFSGSMESITARIAQANSQIPGYKHAKTNSGIEQQQRQQQQQQQQLQSEARDHVGDLGPSLGLKKSSSLESLQTMVQEIQMSEEPRGGPTTCRAPRGRGREEGLRAAVNSDHDVKKAKQTWLLEDGDSGDGGFSQRNGPCQSSLNDGKSKSRAKKPGIFRGIGHMFRFGKNRKDIVAPADNQPAQQPAITNASNERTSANNQIPVAALSVLSERNAKMAAPPAYQPPPPLPPANPNGTGGGSAELNGGIHHNDIFNHRYQHYSNYEELQQNHHQQQLSDENCSTNDVLSESTLECMRQQVLRQRLKVEAESRRHQHYHSQRSARSQDIQMGTYANNPNNNSSRSNQMSYDYETVRHNLSGGGGVAAGAAVAERGGLNNSFQQRMGSIKHSNGHQIGGITINANGPLIESAQPHWKTAAMYGFSPASLNSSARSRGPYVTHVTLGGNNANGAVSAATNSNANSIAAAQQQQQQQPTYQTVQKHHHHHHQQQQHQQQSQYSGAAAGPQHSASKM